jgi:hypothetical protein
MTMLDRVVAFAKVLGSAVLGRNSSVAYSLTGVGDFRTNAQGKIIDADGGDDTGEQAPLDRVYGALGVLGRPLPPAGANAYCEAAALRTSDGLETIAVRDARINRAVNPTGQGIPAAGQQMLAGYGGAFLSVKHDTATGTDILTLYVPYEFDGNGIATKAHAIVIDPAKGIQLIQGDGAVMTLCNDVGNGEPGFSWVMSPGSFGRVSASEVVIQAPSIMLKGNVYLGAQAEAGLPLLAGAASPPSPSVFVSPV